MSGTILVILIIAYTALAFLILMAVACLSLYWATQIIKKVFGE